MDLNFGRVEGLPQEDLIKLYNLQRIYAFHKIRNEKKRRYYNGKIRLGDVNLGIALPMGMAKLEIGCAWGTKTVDVLAARSMFDGFVGEAGTEAESMRQIVKRNRLIAEYKKACKEELKYGCDFAVISGTVGDAKIRFYSPDCAAARWNKEKGRIDCGFAFDDGRICLLYTSPSPRDRG